MESPESNEDSLAACFEQFKSHEFVFVRPGGNHGDYLIYWGAEFLAAQLGLRFRTLSYEQFLEHDVQKREVIYIHGGGGYNRWCSGKVLSALDYALRSPTTHVIQGPCTIDDDREYVRDAMVPVLKRPRSCNLTFMARERLSHHLASELLQGDGVETIISPDTALRLTREEVVGKVGEVSGDYRFYGFREDNEAGDRGFRAEAFGVRFDPALYCRTFEHWVRVHAGARSIVTNRTHSSIIGAILKTDTVLFPSRYHKNRSVWEYSLKDRGVTWSDGQDISKSATRSDLIDFLPHSLRRRRKVQRVVRFLQGVPGR